MSPQLLLMVFPAQVLAASWTSLRVMAGHSDCRGIIWSLSTHLEAVLGQVALLLLWASPCSSWLLKNRGDQEACRDVIAKTLCLPQGPNAQAFADDCCCQRPHRCTQLLAAMLTCTWQPCTLDPLQSCTCLPALKPVACITGAHAAQPAALPTVVPPAASLFTIHHKYR